MYENSQNIDQLDLISTEPLEFFKGLSPNDVKAFLIDGTLLGILRRSYEKANANVALRKIDISRKDLYRVDSSLLSLSLEFVDTESNVCITKELLLEFNLYSNDKNRVWFYPNDPKLPFLKEVSSQDSLTVFSWEFQIEDLFPRGDGTSVTRMSYNPLARATFLINHVHPENKFVLKIMKQVDFEECLLKIQVIQESVLKNRISLPTLVSYSIKNNAFLYFYRPGEHLHKMDEDFMEKVKVPLYEEIVDILIKVHSTAISLPAWNPVIDTDLLYRNVQHFESLRLKGSDIVRSIYEILSECYRSTVGPYPFCIHNDFSEKNILYDDKKGVGFIRENLFIIDWDDIVLGPREKDIGGFLSNLVSDEADRSYFLDLYMRKTACKLDINLVNCFMHSSTFDLLCRKVLRENGAKESRIESLVKIRDDLKNNRLGRQLSEYQKRGT